MLVLSRKMGESIVVGDEVKITVLSVSGKVVRLGIDAPKDISVHREEIFEKVQAANDTDEDIKPNN